MTTATKIRVKLSTAQVSALECRLLDEDEAILDRVWFRETNYIVLDHNQVEETLSALNRASNSELAASEAPIIRGTACALKAIGAAQALANLVPKIVRAAIDSKGTRP